MLRKRALTGPLAGRYSQGQQTATTATVAAICFKNTCTYKHLLSFTRLAKQNVATVAVVTVCWS